MATLLNEAFAYFEQYAQAVVEFSGCVSYVNLLKALVAKGQDNDEQRYKISELSGEFLRREWKNQKPKVTSSPPPPQRYL